MRKTHSYYTKLFLVILITVFVASGLIAGIIIMFTIKDIRSFTEKSLNASAEQKVRIYEVNINSLHSLSLSLSDDEEIKEYFENMKNGIEDPEMFLNMQSDLEEEMKSYAGVMENAFFVFEGKVLMDGLGGTSIGFDIEEEASEWYVNAITTKSHYLGKLKESPITGLPVMVSVNPILDDQGEIIAVFGMAINLNGFSNNIIYNPETTDEITTIIDESGVVVASNNTQLIYEYNVFEKLPDLGSFIQNEKEGITYYVKDGIDYIASVNKSDSGVTIIQSLPVSVYMNPILNSLRIALVTFVGILVGVIVVTFFVAKSITKPIFTLVEEFEDMAKGYYDKEVPAKLIHRKDEFAILGNALSVMKKQTSQMIMNLNLSNEEIEASLEEIIATEDELKRQNELLVTSENELRESNEYNKAIIGVIPDVIFVIDKEGFFRDCQASSQNALFMPIEEFIGKNLKDIMPESIAKTGYEKIQLAMETGKLQSFEYELIIDGKKEVYELRIIKCFIDRVLAIARNITSQRLYQTQIEYLSYHDQLTGIHNRRSFEEALKKIDSKENLPLGVIMADVNGLKLVNDSFGHMAGDMLLSKFAKVLKENYPLHDMIFRIGGDEFVLLLPKYKHEQIQELIETIKMNCNKELVNAVSLSVSFGWGSKEQATEDLNMILKSAEDAMYKNKLFEGPSMRGKTISMIINTLHEKNKREEQHSRRVAELCEKMAIALNMPDYKVKEINNIGLLHDIGKIAISEELLNKPGRLTQEEYDEIKRHPEIGYRILCSANEMTEIAEYVLSHHERWDGKGYPRGLRENAIPIQSRMIAIADTFDAMTSMRSYRDAVSEEDAAREIMENAGTQFDPELVKSFIDKVLGYDWYKEVS